MYDDKFRDNNTAQNNLAGFVCRFDLVFGDFRRISSIKCVGRDHNVSCCGVAVTGRMVIFWIAVTSGRISVPAIFTGSNPGAINRDPIGVRL